MDDSKKLQYKGIIENNSVDYTKTKQEVSKFFHHWDQKNLQKVHKRLQKIILLFCISIVGAMFIPHSEIYGLILSSVIVIVSIFGSILVGLLYILIKDYSTPLEVVQSQDSPIHLYGFVILLFLAYSCSHNSVIGKFSWAILCMDSPYNYASETISQLDYTFYMLIGKLAVGLIWFTVVFESLGQYLHLLTVLQFVRSTTLAGFFYTPVGALIMYTILFVITATVIILWKR